MAASERGTARAASRACSASGLSARGALLVALALAAPGYAQAPEPAAAPDAASSAGCGGISTVGRITGTVTSFFSRPASLLSRIRAGKYCASAQAIGIERDVDNERASASGLAPLPQFTEYANALLERLKAELPITDIPGSVFLLAQQDLVAKSTADGNIYVSIGWVKTLKSEAALAALLAHELGHVVLAHHESDIFVNIQKQFQTLAGSAVSLRRSLEASQRAGAIKQGTPTQGDIRQQIWMQVIIEVSDKLAHPTWNRRQELEADRFALDLTQRLGYGYAGSVKTFLEHVADWEEKLNAESEAQRTELQKLGEADIGKQINADLKRVTDELGRKHDDAGARLKAIETYFDELYAKGPPAQRREDDFGSIVGARGVTQIIAGYDLSFGALDLLAKGDARGALREAQRATGRGSAVARHALPQFVLGRALLMSGQALPAQRAFTSGLDADEPSLESYRELSYALAVSGKPAEGAATIERAFEKFNGAPNLYPVLIEFHARHGQKERAQQLLDECRLKLPGLRERCLSAMKGS